MLSFDKKVAFYKKWKYLFPAMLLPAIFYITWDIFFTSIGVWSFNPEYIVGINLFNLPLEEVLFFLVVPYCCVFIYECVRSYFPAMKDTAAASWILASAGAILLVTGFVFIDQVYTGFTFIFTAIFIAILFLLRHYFNKFHIAAFIISFLISLIPFLIVNGFLTSIPIVNYDNEENLGIRIYSIPVEDIFYGMLLLMMSVAGFERLRGRAEVKEKSVSY